MILTVIVFATTWWGLENLIYRELNTMTLMGVSFFTSIMSAIVLLILYNLRNFK